jgi:AmiR/NasT family two-component response regulator
VRPRWRVLIIDDHARSRAGVAEAVTAQGGQVVGNGSRVEDAVRLVDLHRPDVAVLAVGLGDGDGVEAARQVMSQHPCALVLLTSRTDPRVVARAVETGILGFLAKPLRQEELGPALDLAVSRFHDLEAVRKENQDLKRKLESRKVIDRAKAVLIQQLNLTEPEAHRRIQKAAMDTRRTMADVAHAVLVGEELRRPRLAK